jgi:hypothetical protein
VSAHGQEYVSGWPYRNSMIINCQTCTMRAIACGDCVVSFFLDTPAVQPDREITPATVAALELLATNELVKPLRFVSGG